MSTEHDPRSTEELPGTSRRLNLIGMGPAGAILALRAVAQGWHVVAFDPGATQQAQAEGSSFLPEWHATYGVFSTEVPTWAQHYFHAEEDIRVRTQGDGFQSLGFSYRMMDKQRLRQEITELIQQGDVKIHPEAISPAEAVQLPGHAVDCRGAIAGENALWQLALGYVLPKDSALPPSLSTPTLMDWSPSPAAGLNSAPASFLYVQDTAAGWLVEETILVTRSSPSEDLFELLEQRLESRIHAACGEGWLHNQTDTGRKRILDVERVAIPMGTAATESPIPCFGARAGFIHPATGYSVGTVLQEAESFLLRLGETKQLGTWLNARLAHVLRRIGSLLVAEATPEATRSFFAAFFGLGTKDQLAYLSGRSGIATARTMWRLRKNTGWRHPVLLPLYRRPLKFLRAGLRSS